VSIIDQVFWEPVNQCLDSIGVGPSVDGDRAGVRNPELMFRSSGQAVANEPCSRSDKGGVCGDLTILGLDAPGEPRPLSSIQRIALARLSLVPKLTHLGVDACKV